MVTVRRREGRLEGLGDGGDGLGLGWGCGEGAGAVSTRIVFASPRVWPLGVAAAAAMVTWYWVFGASWLPTGWISRLLPCQVYDTCVAGWMLIELSTDRWSMGWLKLNVIGRDGSIAAVGRASVVTTTVEG